MGSAGPGSMFGATRRGVRWVWMLGGALLALTVLKLLFVDLAGTGTVARIVSFIGVGLLMTVIGYFVVPPAVDDAEGSGQTAQVNFRKR